MGMYTELHFNSELNIPRDCDLADVLAYMTGQTARKPEVTVLHKLFTTERWQIMLRCDSYYFDADTNSTLRWDDNGDSYYLCIRTNLKNYDSEIEKFIDWIMPFCNKSDGEFLGFYRYEENEEPTLIYYHATDPASEHNTNAQASPNVTKRKTI